MRYCHQCHRVTTGEPLFCNFCGSTYEAKLCPARHINPRTAEVCAECGSRDLSSPAPHLSFWFRALLHLLALLPGVGLLAITVLFFGGVLNLILTNQQIQFQILLFGLLLGLLWWLYMHLPTFIKELLRTVWRRSKRNRH